MQVPKSGSRFGWLLVGACAACSVGPRYETPTAALPETWQPQPEPAVNTESGPRDRWWESFRDDALTRLVDLAVQENLPLQVAGLRIEEARAQLALAEARQYPQLAAVGAATAIGLSKSLPYVSSLPELQRNFIGFQAGFDAAWEIDVWGKYRRGVEAESASLSASQADYDFALMSLTAEVARTYAVLRTYEVLIDQAEENARIQGDALDIAQSRFQNGATSELDVAQATSLLESTRASIPTLRTSEQAARNALSKLLGQPPGALDALVAGAREIPAPPQTVPVGVPAAILSRRPDVRSAAERAAAQSARIGVAESELYPMLALTGDVGLMTTTASGLDVNLLDMLTYTVGPQISWTFLDFGRRWSGVRVEDARYQQLLVDYRDVVLRAAQEVEDALAGYQNAAAAVALQERAVRAAMRAVEISIVQYREGATDYQRVLDSQRSLLELQMTLSQTRSTVTTSVIALYKALGGGWDLHRTDGANARQP